MTKTNKKKELGQGIRALLGDIEVDEVQAQHERDTLNNISEILIDQIEVNPYQPRVDFDEERLQELADSIRVHGVIQPITVRRLAAGQYQLIAGERRLRASRIAGMQLIPAYIRQANDQAMLEIALIENIQREDLNPVEVALTYQRLLDECALTHDILASRLGKNRSTVTNFLRLLKLPPEIQLGLKSRQITSGHARALISLEAVEQQLALYKTIIEKALSVRQVEELVRQMGKQSEKKAQPIPTDKVRLPIHFKKVQENLESLLGTKVDLKRSNKGKGQIVISFASDAELNRILGVLET